MRCQRCGAETQDSFCPVCGEQIQSLPQNAQTAPYKQPKKNKKIFYVAIIVLLVLVGITVYIVTPISDIISQYGVVKGILRLFGAVGAVFWLAAFCHIIEYFDDKFTGKNRALNGALALILTLLIIFCMACTHVLFE